MEEHGPANSRQIARIIVDPIDFNVVYVAALGDLWGAGGERGVYKTSDGGKPGTACFTSTTTPARPIW